MNWLIIPLVGVSSEEVSWPVPAGTLALLLGAVPVALPDAHCDRCSPPLGAELALVSAFPSCKSGKLGPMRPGRLL